MHRDMVIKLFGSVKTLPWAARCNGAVETHTRSCLEDGRKIDRGRCRGGDRSWSRRKSDRDTTKYRSSSRNRGYWNLGGDFVGRFLVLAQFLSDVYWFFICIKEDPDLELEF